ncbi:MAG: hypothetical protein ABW321_18715 [Polyangiales bacterium]
MQAIFLHTYAGRVTRRVALALSLWCWASAGRAHAETPHVPPTYYQLVDSALREYHARRYAEAKTLMHQAHAVWPNARTYRGLGKVSFELAHYRDAFVYLDQAQRSRLQPLDAAMREDAEHVKRLAQAQLVPVELRLVPSDAVVRVDGAIETSARTGRLVLDPGVHTVEVSAPGHAPTRRSYALRPSDRPTWSIQLQANSTLPQAAELSPDTGKSTSGSSGRQRLLLASNTGLADGGANPDKPRWLLPTGLSLAFVGVAAAGVGAGFLVAYGDNGEKFRGARQNLLAYEARFLDARANALLFTGIGSGLLSLGTAALGELVPPQERRWLSPAMAAAGAGLLIAGLAIYADNGCDRSPGQTLQTCSTRIERQDSAAMMAMLSAPLLSAPLVHAVEWLFFDD